MALSKKENFMMAMNHQIPERTPIFLYDCAVTGFCTGPGPWFEKGPIGGGYDGFGVRWLNAESGSGAPMAAPGEFILDSDTIVDWKKIVKFPDVGKFDWEEYAKQDLAGIDRGEMVVDFGSGNGPFERLAALMGFEEALIAMALEPDACYELVGAIVDYKIQVVEQVAKYIKPDMFTNYDDVATELGLFMSPDAYREIIKPHTKRYYDAIKAFDMMPIQHTCGYATDLVQDFIELGAQAWTSVQPTNDIVALQEQYGDQLTFMGGFDTNGPAAREDASPEIIQAEVERCFDTYGPRGSFILFAYKLLNTTDPEVFMAECMKVIGPAVAYSYKAAGMEIAA